MEVELDEAEIDQRTTVGETLRRVERLGPEAGGLRRHVDEDRDLANAADRDGHPESIRS
jgi:hypothetical protein